MAFVWLFPLAVRRVHLVPALRGHRAARLRVDRRHVQLRQLHQGLHGWAPPHVLPQHVDRRGAGRLRDPAPRLDDGVRPLPLQLAVQPALPDALHGGQPAAAAGHHHAALPDVPGPAAAAGTERQRPVVRPVLRRDRDPRRLPAGLLHLRAEQLHEDASPGAERGRRRRRRQRVPDLLAGSSCPSRVPRSPRSWSSR